MWNTKKYIQYKYWYFEKCGGMCGERNYISGSLSIKFKKIFKVWPWPQMADEGSRVYTLPDISLPGSQGWPCSFAKGTPTEQNSCQLLNFEESSLWPLRAWVWQFSSVTQCVQLFTTTWTSPCQASLSITKLPEPTQTHVHWASDAVQTSHPLSAPSPAFNLSQHQGLFHWVSSSHQVAKVFPVSALASFLPVNIQDWFPLGWTRWVSLQSKGLSIVFSNTTVQKHQFFSTQVSL